MKTYAATVRAPEYPPHMKHRVIFETFSQLNPGETMLLENDHDPVPLRYQFEAEHKGSYTWEYVERGPSLFQVEIGRI
jgi:uncharacterized protein (DUF2249 family)